jgi:hypothetical protein
MDCFKRSFLFVRSFKRSASIAFVALLGSLPPSGTCSTPLAAISQNFPVITLNSNELTNTFNDFEEQIKQAKDPLSEGRKILQSLIDEINALYGCSLSIEEACRLVKENMEMLNLDGNTQEILIGTICLLEEKNNPTPNCMTCKCLKIKKKKKPPQYVGTKTCSDPGTKGSAIIGVLEIVAGASIGLVTGGTILGGITAGGLIVDGLTRVADKGQSDLDSFLNDLKDRQNIKPQ